MEAKPQVSGTIIPLASPRGTEKQCELCQRVARLQCAGHFFTELIEICRLVPALLRRCLWPQHCPAEANMGQKHAQNELLSQAEWSVLKSPDCGHAVHHRLHRSLGRLHMATGNLEQALLHFANDIYFASEEYSLDSIVTCGGYFLMADAFVEQGKMPIARSVYSEVAQTWHLHPTNILKTRIPSAQNPNMLLDSSCDYQSDKAQLVKVDEMLRTMLEFEQKDPAQIARVAHCLAMLWFLAGDSRKALGFGSTALQASQLIPNHDLTEPIQSLLQLVQSLQTDSHPGSD